MENYKIIRSHTQDDTWTEVGNDLAQISYPFTYNANIQHKERTIFLSIEVDPGGGFESGFQSTSLVAPVTIQFTTLSSRIKEQQNFRFAIHDEDFIDKVGKFFGMEDAITGYKELDKSLVVKTNDVEKVKLIFGDVETRRVFQTLVGFNLHIAYYNHNDQHCSLELNIDRELTNVEELKKVFMAFVNVLESFEEKRSFDL